MADKSAERPSVLIIEDSPELVGLLIKNFEYGYSVSSALDGEEGLRLAQSCRPDIVLLDVNLPKVNGFDILSAIRLDDASRSISVIMITSLSQPENIVKALKMGADDYIIKPFSIVELTARVNSRLKIKELQRQVMDMERLKVLREVAVAFNHEVNNPLMSISAFAYFIRDGLSGGDAEMNESAEGILREVTRISGIVSRLSEAVRAASVEYAPGVGMIDLEDPGL